MARRDPAVVLLQQQLAAAGINPGAIDGIMGPRTRSALATYKARHGGAAPGGGPPPPAPAPAPAPAPVQAAPTPGPSPADQALAAGALPSDPGYMAFLRASGLGLETAANQVRQQTGNINAALETSMGDLGHSYDQQSKSRQGGYESRGILRSGETQQGLDEVERARANAQAQARSGAANQISTLNQSLAQKVADTQNQAAERGLSVAQNQDFDSQMTALKQKYPEYYAGGGK